MSNYSIVPNADLTSIADAIRAKGGTSAALVFPAEFVSAIQAIPTGGGAAEPEEKDVDFIDYDGTLLYSYTAAEFLAMSEMPPNPSHAGLIAQGWNWTLADAKEIVRDCGFHVIGQNYTTSDGATRIYITIPDGDQISPMQVIMYGYDAFSVVIDWGDGTVAPFSLTNAGAIRGSHTYSSAGNYIIRIYDVVGSTVCLGYAGAHNGIVWGNGAQWNAAIKWVKKIEIGEGFTELGTQPFTNLNNLASVSIPTSCGETNATVTSFSSEQSSIRGLVIPHGVLAIGNNMRNNGALRISLPKTINQIGNNQYYRSVKKLVIPDGPTTFAAYTFRELYGITRLRLPSTVTEYPDNFSQNIGYGLAEITIPAGVTSIGTNFMNGTRLLKIHLKPTTPPTLKNVNAFPNLHSNAVFYVPYSADHSILNAYQTASNWSTFASYMVEE